MRNRIIGLSIAAIAVVGMLAGPPASANEGELGLIGGLLLPTNDLIGSSATHLSPGLGVRGEYLFAETGGWFIDGVVFQVPIDNAADVDWLTARTGFNIYFKPHTERQMFYLQLGGGWYEAKQDSVTNLEGGFASLGFGQRFRTSPTFRVRWEIRADRTVSSSTGPDDNFTTAQGLISFNWGLGVQKKDTDGDGVFDHKDDCPDTPAGATVDAKGCPLDGDGDGVFDGIDKCPGTPAGWPVDKTGCPTDSDGDGVKDGEDACPNTPRGAKVDSSGCPTDGDKDGVPDGIDKCPDTPSGVKVDATGCPTAKPIAEKAPLILDGVYFAYNKAELSLNSNTVLHEVAESLKAWPDVKVEIGGFTDSKGSDAYNLKLSQARAESVRNFLIQQGIAANRLTAKGYGKANPIATNDTEEGRAKNRRVEMKRN